MYQYTVYQKDRKIEIGFKRIERWLMYLGSCIENLETSSNDNQEIALIRRVRDELLSVAFTGEDE